ncbi:hypothetical protein [Kribbella deserti]|uniref:Uncharacterized protein n=1 Tax=Kribbella deserti TaxID=1926257 RepID=A0ABV6QXF6_9ACTN
MSRGSMNDPVASPAMVEMVKRMTGLWAVLTTILFGGAAIQIFAWWDAQANDLAGGPRGGYSSDAMFPWFFVVPAVLAGLWTTYRGVASARLYGRLKRQLD